MARQVGDGSSGMLRKQMAKIEERLPACETGRDDEMGVGGLQNNSITDTHSKCRQ